MKEDERKEAEEKEDDLPTAKRARLEEKIDETAKETKPASFGFGGSFAGFAALKPEAGGGFGTAATTSTTTTTSGGFAAFATTGSSQGGFKLQKGDDNPFASTTFGASAAFGGTPFDPATEEVEASKANEASPPPEETPANGEEDELCLARYRAKLFELVKPTTEEKGNTSPSNSSTKEINASPAWSERGIGQLRVLQSLDAGTMRIVMRREQTHSLLLNIKLAAKLVTVAKHADTAIRLVSVTAADAAATYLLRIKTRADRDALFEYIQRPLEAPPQSSKEPPSSPKEIGVEKSIT